MSRHKYSALRRRIEKLEEAAGMGRKHCPNCRLNHRGWLAVEPNYPIPPGGDLVIRHCEFCHSRFLLNLKGTTDGSQGEMRRLMLTFTQEDTYTDPRAKAAAVWWRNKFARQPSWPAATESGAKGGRDARTYLKLREEVERLTKRKRRRLKAKYGPPSYSEFKDMMRSIKSRPSRAAEAGVSVPTLSNLEDEESDHLFFAELEKIIRGEPFSETTAALEDVRRRISDAVEEARRDEARRKADIKRHEDKALRRANQEMEEEAKWIDDPRFQMAQVDE